MTDSVIEDIEYVEVVAARDLTRPRRVEGRLLLAAAAKVGGTRLIDNIVFDVEDAGGARESRLF
jgi:pantothenate synthetase